MSSGQPLRTARESGSVVSVMRWLDSGCPGACEAPSSPAMSDVARLFTDEKTARRIASLLGETLDSEDAVCGAFEDENGQWQIAIHSNGGMDEPRLRGL